MLEQFIMVIVWMARAFLLTPPIFSGAVVGNACIFRRLFQKLAGCEESGIFRDVFINFKGLLEIL